MGKSMIFFAVLAIAIMLSIMVFAQDINSTKNKTISGAHKDSGKVTVAFPDKCNTPSAPAGPVPVPYPNTAMSSDTKEGSKVKMDGNPTMLKESNFSKSTGDEKGTANIVRPQHKQYKGYFMQMRQQRRPAASPTQQMMPAAPEQIMQSEEPFKQMLPVAPTKDWIEIELKDEVVKKIPSEKFKVMLPDGKVRKGSIDSQGKAKIGEIEPAKIHVSFPEDKGKRLEQQQ